MICPYAEDEKTFEAKGPEKFGGAISLKPTYDQNDAKLYSDNRKRASDNSVTGGKLQIGVDDDEIEIIAKYMGYKTEEVTISEKKVTVITKSGNDKQKYAGFGYIDTKEGKYKVNFFKKIKLIPYDSDSQTAEEKTQYSTPTIEADFYLMEDGSFKKEAEVDTLDDAVAVLKEFFKPVAEA